MAKYRVGDEIKVVRSINKYIENELVGKCGVILREYKNSDTIYYEIHLHKHTDDKVILFPNEIELNDPRNETDIEAIYVWLSSK